MRLKRALKKTDTAVVQRKIPIKIQTLIQDQRVVN